MSNKLSLEEARAMVAKSDADDRAARREAAQTAIEAMAPLAQTIAPAVAQIRAALAAAMPAVPQTLAAPFTAHDQTLALLVGLPQLVIDNQTLVLNANAEPLA